MILQHKRTEEFVQFYAFFKYQTFLLLLLKPSRMFWFPNRITEFISLKLQCSLFYKNLVSCQKNEMELRIYKWNVEIITKVSFFTYITHISISAYYGIQGIKTNVKTLLNKTSRSEYIFNFYQWRERISYCKKYFYIYFDLFLKLWIKSMKS